MKYKEKYEELQLKIDWIKSCIYQEDSVFGKADTDKEKLEKIRYVLEDDQKSFRATMNDLRLTV